MKDTEENEEKLRGNVSPSGIAFLVDPGTAEVESISSEQRDD